MKLRIKDAMIRGIFLKKIFETLKVYFFNMLKEMDRFIGIIFRYFFSIFTPVDDKQIMFITFQGDYTCNPRYITEQLLKENVDYKIVWSLRQASIMGADTLDPRINVVEVYSSEFYREFMKSRIIFANSVEFLKQPTHLKKKQILIETWHGSLGIKRFGRENNSGKTWVRAAEICGKRAKYIISNSTFEDNVYRETFWPKTEILQYGHPRNDVFFNKESITVMKEKIFKLYDIDMSYKLFLYAPTFRDEKNFNCYRFDVDELINSLTRKFGGEWKIAIRFHPTVRKSKLVKYFFKNSNVINMTSYPDIQDILLIADAAMTDYSSWIYDYVLTKRPGFIYARDIEKYYNERGFYYSLYDTPFSVATDQQELCKNILSFDFNAYNEKVDEFLREKGCVEDGNASCRVVKKIKELLAFNDF